MSITIAKQWLAEAPTTACEKKYNEHMDLISQRISLQGMPGFDNIGYDDWTAQCKHAFENNLIKSVQYQGIKLLAESDTHIIFKTYKTVEGMDGTVNAQGVKMLLELEPDQKWRLVQECVLPEDESKHDGLRPQ